jgi:hypothetical protein
MGDEVIVDRRFRVSVLELEKPLLNHMAAKFDEVVGELGKALDAFVSGSYIFEGGFHSDDMAILYDKYVARVLFCDGFTDDARGTRHLFVGE